MIIVLPHGWLVVDCDNWFATWLADKVIYHNKKYVLWNVHLPNALYSVCLNRLSCTEVEIYNNANSPNGFLTTAVA